MSASERARTIEADALYPRDDANRYRIYLRSGEGLRVLATAGDPEALGVALVTLHQDAAPGRLYDDGQIGVLDCVAHEWIILPWQRRPHIGALRPDPEPKGDPCRPKLRPV